MGCSRLSVQTERERRGESGAGEERENFFAVPVLFLLVSTNESHKGDHSSGHLSGTFAFAHGTNPDLSFSPFEKGGKRGAYHWLPPPPSTGWSFVTQGFGDLPS